MSFNGNPGESSGQFYGSNLFGGPTLEWIYESPPGQPYRLVGPFGAQKGIYHFLTDTHGELTEELDPAEPYVENERLEGLMANSVGLRAINGWTSNLWHNFHIKGTLRQSRVDTTSSSPPTHLAYSLSTDYSVYSIRKASIINEAERVVYPYALSNLISITIRRHRLDTGTSPLRHLIFHNVTNLAVGTAMSNAFNAMGVTLAVLPATRRRNQYQEEASTRSQGSRHRTAHQGGGRSRLDQGNVEPARYITINQGHTAAWNQLHTNNPFTKVLAHVQREIEGLPPIVSYTLIAVAQPREGQAQQMYCCALIAHLGSPAVVGGTGSGPEMQYGAGQPSDAGSHWQC